MNKVEYILKVKDDVDLFKILPKYNFDFYSDSQGGIWRKVIQTTLGDYYGFDEINISNKTREIKYSNRPIFNYDLKHCVKDLINDGLIIEENNKDDYIDVSSLVEKIKNKTIKENSLISIRDLESIVEEYK